tara:strand:- start:474 stop:791 length:318 start_codon:yes stop_codon:yes gene_type:complete
MRELKFRAWRHGGGDPRVEGAMHYSYPFMTNFWIDELEWDLASEVMQYTGLKDGNDKEIYEGDLLHIYGYGVYQVEYPSIELFEAASEGDIGDILGNIHENPELS